MNMTILEKVRCLLNESSLPKRFWAEGTNTAIYLINRSPSSAINFKTPMHIWTGSKPNLNRLRPFGCIAYIHVNQGKLSPRAIKGIFIGYPTSVKGYKVWLLGEKKCVVSRNVIFHESTTTNNDMQECIKPPKTDNFQFEVESPPDHHSQGELDAISDHGDISPGTKSHTSHSDGESIADKSPVR